VGGGAKNRETPAGGGVSGS